VRRLLLLLALCAWGGTSQAESLQSLTGNDQLRLRSWLQPTGDIAVGQEVILTIEVATRRWFAGGTRIRPGEVPHLIILQRNQFATNLSRREDGATWVVQQWQLELYPQRAGDFRLPPVELELAVNDAEAGIVRGRLQTRPLAFSVQIPPLLAAVDNWIATPGLSVTQQFDREPASLRPGDAIERQITLRATRVTAMMLPTPQVIEFPGLSAYPDNPELIDRSNRGEATAERIERVTYVIERAGQYRLPEQVFHYWDTDAQVVATAVLPAVTIDAGVAAADGPTVLTRPGFIPDWRWALYVMGLLLLLGAAAKLRALRSRTSARKTLAAAVRAQRAGDNRGAVRLLYSWLNEFRPGEDWLSLRRTISLRGREPTRLAVEEMLDAAYGESASTTPTGVNLKRLERGKGLASLVRRLRPQSAPLDLNPGSSAGGQKARE